MQAHTYLDAVYPYLSFLFVFVAALLAYLIATREWRLSGMLLGIVLTLACGIGGYLIGYRTAPRSWEEERSRMYAQRQILAKKIRPLREILRPDQARAATPMRPQPISGRVTTRPLPLTAPTTTSPK